MNDVERIFSRLSKYSPNQNGFAANQSLEIPDKKYSLVFALGKGNRRKALISAGIHGDEPASVETKGGII